MSPPLDCTMGVWPRVGLVSRITLSARQCSTLARVSAIVTRYVYLKYICNVTIST